MNRLKRSTQNNPLAQKSSKKIHYKDPEKIDRQTRNTTRKILSCTESQLKKYDQMNPTIHREAVINTILNNPNVNKDAVSSYNKKKPEVNVEAARRYNEKRQLIPWKNTEQSGFQYDHTKDYSNDKVVSLGQRVECKWCHAIKWKDESPGMCCNNSTFYYQPAS